MAAFNPTDPMYQRDIQRMQAANSKGYGTRIGSVLQSKIAATHAQNQLARQLEFGKLALQNKASMQAFQHAKDKLAAERAGYNLRRTKYKDSKDDMRTSLWTGLAGTGLNYLEGERRKKELAAANARQEERQGEIINIMRAMYNRPTSTYLRGGL